MSNFEVGDAVIIMNMDNYVSKTCLGKEGFIMETPIYDKHYRVACGGMVFKLKENQIQAKGMREFIAGDVIKNPITNGFAKVLFVSEDNTLIRYIEDGDKGYKHKGSEVLIIKHDLQNFRLANDEWIHYQTKQKAKEENKKTAEALRRLADDVENGNFIPVSASVVNNKAVFSTGTLADEVVYHLVFRKKEGK